MSISPNLANPQAPDIALPVLIAEAGNRAAWRFLEFFTVNIRKCQHAGGIRPRGRVVSALV
jgi:hypothetical protein